MASDKKITISYVAKKMLETSLKYTKTISTLSNDFTHLTKIVYSMSEAVKTLTEVVLDHHNIITRFKAYNELMAKQLAKNNSNTFDFPELNSDNKEQKSN